MKAENITARVVREEKMEAERMERAMQQLRTLLSAHASKEMTLNTHGQLIQAVSMVLNPEKKEVPPVIELQSGAGWYIRSQFSQQLRTILNITNTRWTLGDLLAEIDRRLSARKK